MNRLFCCLLASLMWLPSYSVVADDELSVGVVHYDRLIADIESLQQMRRDFDFGILKMKAGLSRHYDYLNAQHAGFQRSVIAISDIFSQFSPRYDWYYHGLKDNANQMRRSYELFKSSHALTVNAQSYIPYLAQRIRKLVSEAGFKRCRAETSNQFALMSEQLLISELALHIKPESVDLGVIESSALCAGELGKLNDLIQDIQFQRVVYHQALSEMQLEIAKMIQWEKEDPLNILLPILLEQRSQAALAQQQRENLLLLWLAAISGILLVFFLLFFRYYRTSRHHHKQSLTDSLTGVGNRLHLYEYAQGLMQDNDVDNIALFYIDLDGFKLVNDTFSHAEGDRVLVDISDTVAYSIRREDRLFRLGGDEFVVVSSGFRSKSGVVRIAETLLKSCHRLVESEGKSVEVSSSIGITLLQSRDIAVGELIAEADKAMYEAKRCGKNRYIFSEKSEDDRLPSSSIEIA